MPSEKIYEDANCFAFLNIHPDNIGHSLVIPKTHYTNLYEISDETLAHLAPVAKKLAVAIKSATRADGINLVMNNDPAAGQIIFHAHIHIIPRFLNDGFKHWKGARGYHDGEMASVGEAVRKNLA